MAILWRLPAPGSQNPIMIGPGKYDDLCTRIRIEADAQGVILIVMHGNQGSDMSVQAPLDSTLRLPAALRNLADQIEADFRGGKL